MPTSIPPLSRCLLLLTLLVASAEAQRALIVGIDELGETGAGYGTALTTLPDRDGDGRDELVVGIPRRSPGGAVIVLSSFDGSTLDERPAAGFNDAYGTSVTRVTDVDGDGVDDLLVGAPQILPFDAPGYAELLSGADLSLIHQFPGGQPVAGFGFTVAALGDIDGDHSGDFAIAAPTENAASTDSGVVRVYSGNGGSPLLLRTESGAGFDTRLGGALANAGDVDGDGVHDLIAGTGSAGSMVFPGSAIVWSGATGAVLHEFPADAPGLHFGGAVSGAGDVNRDGHADLLVGARSAGADETGLARLYSGADGSPLMEWTGSSAFDRLGTAVAGGADVDGDGWPDIAVTLARALADTPALVRVYSGRDFTLLDEHVARWNSDFFGTGLVAAPDMDGDGGDELLAGAPAGSSGLLSGYGMALSHRPITRAPLFTVQGTEPFGYLGRDASGGSDLNGDGVPDFVVGGEGANLFDGSIKNEGRLRAHSGADGSEIWTRAGPSFEEGQRFGEQLTLFGDANGDGVDDLAVWVTAPDVTIHVLSGVDGSLLYGVPGDGLPAYGGRLEPAGDHDGDGVGDFLAGTASFLGQGTVRVHSGATGAVLATLPGPPQGGHFGDDGICALGDTDGDGVPDYAVGATYDDFGADQLGGSGTVYVKSGADGSTLARIEGTRVVDRFGDACVAVPDQDGDGAADVAVWARGQANFGNVKPQLRIHSTRNGSVLATYQPAGTNGAQSSQLVSLGDLDGDGGADVACLVVGSTGSVFNNRVEVVALDEETRRFFLAGPTPEWDESEFASGIFAALSAAGDMDGDGLTEFVTTSVQMGTERQGAGFVLVSRPPTWQGVGADLELAGVWGTPALRIEGELFGDDPLGVRAAGGPAHATAYLVVGLDTWFAPFKGGTFVPALDLSRVFSLDVDGERTLATTWPVGVPGGLQLFAQVWIVDPSAPAGFASSNALVGTTP